MTENVENFEITWDNDNIYLRFTDLFGDGERLGLSPEDAEKLRDAISKALVRYRKGR